MTIVIKDVIKTDLAVSTEDGDTLHEVIAQNIRNGTKINIDFLGLDLVATAFLNNAFGKLYKDFESSKLNDFIKIINIEPFDLELLKDVRDRVLNKNLALDNILKEEFGNGKS